MNQLMRIIHISLMQGCCGKTRDAARAIMREVRSEPAVRSLYQLRKGAAQRAVVVADDELGLQQR